MFLRITFLLLLLPADDGGLFLCGALAPSTGVTEATGMVAEETGLTSLGDSSGDGDFAAVDGFVLPETGGAVTTRSPT